MQRLRARPIGDRGRDRPAAAGRDQHRAQQRREQVRRKRELRQPPAQDSADRRSSAPAAAPAVRRRPEPAAAQPAIAAVAVADAERVQRGGRCGLGLLATCVLRTGRAIAASRLPPTGLTSALPAERDPPAPRPTATTSPDSMSRRSMLAMRSSADGEAMRRPSMCPAS